jgi:type IV pilus assembly protein PilQ
MIIRRPFLLLIILTLLSVPAFIINSEVQSATQSEIIYIGVTSTNGTSEIEIQSSAAFKYTVYKPADPYHVVVDLQDTELGNFQETIVIDRAGVLEIFPLKVESAPNTARLDIALTVPVDIEPIYQDNTLILAFDNPEAQEEKEETAAAVSGDETADEIVENSSVEDVLYTESEEEYEVEEELVTPVETYVGEKISIDFQDADLIHVFRLIADISGKNIVVSPDVKGKFSLRLTDIPWDQALDIILRNYGLSKTEEGSIIRIAPTSVLAREEEEIAKAKESQEKSGNLETRIYPINYANVDDIKKSIDDAKILTKRGFISVDIRTTSVIIKDVEKKHAEYAALIKALDEPTRQVSISARIVEVTTNFTKELGIQWGFVYKPTEQSRIGGTSLTAEPGEFSLSPLLVNLPASVAKGAGGALGIGYVSADNLRALDIQISALETSGKGKIVSSPKVITMDNQKAKILQGKKIPYTTISDEGTKTEFVDAALELIVTPHITPEGTILMNVVTKKNEANFSQTSEGGVPTIDTNELESQVLVKDGDTLALGGIFKTASSDNMSTVPGLGSIPYLGWLFKNKSDKDEVTELLIFITPSIIK